MCLTKAQLKHGPIFSSYIRAYPVFAAMAAAATLAKEWGVVRSGVVVEYVVSKDVFAPWVYILLFMAGLLLVASMPRPSVVKAVVRRFSPCVLMVYAGVAGGIAGWGVTLCALHVVSGGATQWSLAFSSGVLVFVMTAAPLWIYAQAWSVYDEYSAWRMSPRRAWLWVRLTGWVIVGMAVWGAYDWLQAMG